MDHRLELHLLHGNFAVCRLPHDCPLPDWARSGEFVSVTRTGDELSIVCSESDVPPRITCVKGWNCLRVEGTLDFEMVGVLASMVVPLARAGIGVFCLSTFDTDYLFVKGKDLEKAISDLEDFGHRVVDAAETSSG